VGKPERTQLGRPRRIWEDNIKLDLQSGLGVIDLIDVTQDRDRLRARLKR
jgi:hypothetical protein